MNGGLISKSRKRQGMLGFSLLEAVVALAILAAVGMALFAAINQSVQMVSRAEQARQLDAAMLNSLAWLETVNPAQTPTGEQVIGDVEMRWKATLIEDPQPSLRNVGQGGDYWVGLYLINVELWRDGELFASLDLRRVGYAQGRDSLGKA